MIIRVSVWGENIHEQTQEAVRLIYPDGMHTTLARAINEDPELLATTATLQDPGLPQQYLDQTDVLIWWGHRGHDLVADELVDRIEARVHAGMGLVVLHSAHYSKIFQRLMGTPCSLKWREDGKRERIWVCNPAHRIAQGLGASFDIPHEEMYGEPFAVPEPLETVLISWFEGGEVFRSGLCYQRGKGKIFYFRPGHETYPTYHQKEVQQVIRNAIYWAAM